MQISILHLLEGAKVAKGLTVIIDVFRAFSTACYVFHFGAKKIISVGNLDYAYELKEKNNEFILIGERNEQKPAGFDFGNSPTLLTKSVLKGKTVVHTTSSGTQGITHAKNADEIITGSFVNAGAIIRYIQKKQPKTVSLVCMGYACQYPTDEDTLCAQYIKNELEGKASNFPKIINKIKSGDGARFFNPEKQQWSPQKDFELCLSLNRFNFVLKVEKENDLNYLRKTSV